MGAAYLGGQELSSLLKDTPSTGLKITSTLALLSCLLSAKLILDHLRNYRVPKQQRYIIRICLIVPIYAIDSLLGFAMVRRAELFSILRDTYEAYVLYNFFQLLMDFLGGHAGTVEMWNKYNPGARISHMFPLNLVVKPFRLTQGTLDIWRWLLVQYLLFSPMNTLIRLSALAMGVELTWDPGNFGFYLNVVMNLSVTAAFTALFNYYLTTKKLPPMKPFHPTGKFIAVKLVVFLSFWQSIVISALGSYGLFPVGIRRFLFSWAPHKKQVADTEAGLENMLTVVEMVVTACLQLYVFSALEYSKKKVEKQVGFKRAFLHAFSINDVVEETASCHRDLVRKKTQ